jgi:Mg2+/Co2+ transporter CorB
MLLTLLAFLIFMSGYFSMAETGMMAINRYRLRHLVRQNNPKAIRVAKLLEHPERLLGVILVGNCFATILASAIATVLAERTWGESSLALTTFILALIILVFSEISPKTFAASYAQKVAFSFSFSLTWLLKIFYPIVWSLNMVSKGIFKISGIKIEKSTIEHLSQEELRTVVHEAGSRLLIEHQDILLKALDLQKITVNDIMIPNHEIQGIDLEDNWNTILEKISHSYHARLLVYHNNIENIRGVLHIRKIVFLLQEGKLNREALINLIEEPYFLPEETPLLTQLINFRQRKYRIGFVVNEYGDVQGLITLEDILKEIVGEFTTNMLDTMGKNIFPQPDGSFIVDGSTNIREINRIMNLDLPTNGPKTISGLIITYLEMIPTNGTCVLISNHPIEVIQVKDNKIKTARIFKSVSKIIDVETVAN